MTFNVQLHQADYRRSFKFTIQGDGFDDDAIHFAGLLECLD